MPMYNYYCNRCDLNYPDLRKYEERLKMLTCPECGKRQCPMTYDVSKNFDGWKGTTLIKGGGTPKFYGNVSNKKKMEKRWLEDEVKNADHATQCKTGISPYSRMDIDHNYWESQGVAKKVSKKEGRQRAKNSKKLTAEAAKNVPKEYIERSTRGSSEAIRKDK